MKAKVIFMTLSVVATFGFLSAQATKTRTTNSTKKVCYVDANNNNVCDKSEKKTCNGEGKGLRDGNGQCLRDGSRRGNGKSKANGANFIDANHNGVCDNNEVKK